MIRLTRLSTPLIFFACLSLAACDYSGSSASSATTQPSSSTGAGGGISSGTSTNSGYTISGAVSGITGVSVTLTGAASSATTTDTSGNFSFATLGAGNYTISPSKTGYVFSPVSLAATVSSASLTDLTFAATASTAATYTISGTVVGSAVAGVVITLNGSNVGSALTDLSGNYTFSGLVNGTYTVTASLDGYSFTSPLIVSLSNVDSASNNFTSAASGGSVAFTAVNTLPQATVGSPYSSSVIKSISGGTAPYHYASDTLAAGTPPLGMIVNPSGNLTGTPNLPGQYDFSVCATDSTGDTSPCEATSITVVAAPTSQPTPTPTPTPSAAPTVVLAASPSTITAGNSSVLTWSSKNATSCAASGGWTGTKADSGSFTVAPTTTTTLVLTCAGPGGSGHASTLITVRAATPAPVAPTVTLTASHTTIPAGTTTTLTWSSKNASSCVGSGGWTGTEATSGTHSVSPTSTTSYTLQCTSSAGTAETSTKVTVDAAAPVPAPTVSLTASSTSISSGASSTLTWATSNASSCTASGGWSGTESVSGTHSVSPTATTTYTLACKGAGGNGQAAATVTVSGTQPPPPPPPPPPSGTSWVYYNGVFDWPGDYSYEAVPNYSDTSGNPLSGSHDIKVTLTSAWGGWLPYAQNWSFNSAGYTKLTFALKPTVPNQSWQVFFVKVGDVPVGIYVDPAKYGPAPVVGQWNTYTIPLADLGVLGTTIYKFGIADQTGLSNNSWYVDNVGFAR
jgi:hypothetical protein